MPFSILIEKSMNSWLPWRRKRGMLSWFCCHACTFICTEDVRQKSLIFEGSKSRLSIWQKEQISWTNLKGNDKRFGWISNDRSIPVTRSEDDDFLGGSCWTRFSRFCATSCFRASRSASDRINAFCIPTRKHFANRQQLQNRRDLNVTTQSPSCWQTKSRL